MPVDVDLVAKFATKQPGEGREAPVEDPEKVQAMLAEARAQKGSEPPIIDVDVETDGLRPYLGHRPFLVQFSIGALTPPECSYCGGQGWFEGEEDEPVKCEECGGTGELPQELIVEVLRVGVDDDRIQHWLDHPYARYRAWNTKFDMAMLEQAGFKVPPAAFQEIRTDEQGQEHECWIYRWLDGMVEAQLADENTSWKLELRYQKLFGENDGTEAAVKDWLAAEKKRRKKASKDSVYQWLEDQGLPQKRNRNPQIPPGLDIPPELKYVPPTYKDVPPEIMTPYARADIVKTRRVGDWYSDKLPPRLREEVYPREMKVLAAAYDIERRGLPVEEAMAWRAFEHSQEAFERKLDRVRELAGNPNFNPGSPDQVAKALLKRDANIKFASKTKTGKPKTDEENLSAIPDELAAAILDWRGEDKMLNTYLRKMVMDTYEDDERVPRFLVDTVDGIGRIHTNLNQVGARTRRFSSSNPNLQNWHRDDLRLRHLVQASPGKVLVAADMDAIEARVMAFYAGEGALREVFRDPDKDYHTYTAEQLGLTDYQRPGGSVETARQRGKRMNYLLGYNGGIRAISHWFHVDQAEARTMKERWYEAYPEMAQLNDDIEWRLADRGYIECLYGTRQRIRPGRFREESYKFLNYLVQGTVGEMFKIAVVRLFEAGVPLVGLYHDETLAEVPPEDAEETQRLMEWALTDFPEVTQYVPLDADSNVVSRWSFAKDPDYTPPYLEAD